MNYSWSVFNRPHLPPIGLVHASTPEAAIAEAKKKFRLRAPVVHSYAYLERLMAQQSH